MRRDAPVKTFEEYVAFEATANMQHEFIDGNLFVMAGGSQVFDRNDRWEQYQQIPTLEQYVLLSQSEAVAEVYSRQGQPWLYERLTGDATLHFSSLEFNVSLPELYEGIPELGQAEDQTPPAGSSG